MGLPLMGGAARSLGLANLDAGGELWLSMYLRVSALICGQNAVASSLFTFPQLRRASRPGNEPPQPPACLPASVWAWPV